MQLENSGGSEGEGEGNQGNGRGNGTGPVAVPSDIGRTESDNSGNVRQDGENSSPFDPAKETQCSMPDDPLKDLTENGIDNPQKNPAASPLVSHASNASGTPQAFGPGPVSAIRCDPNSDGTSDCRTANTAPTCRDMSSLDPGIYNSEGDDFEIAIDSFADAIAVESCMDLAAAATTSITGSWGVAARAGASVVAFMRCMDTAEKGAEKAIAETVKSVSGLFDKPANRSSLGRQHDMR